MRVSTLLQNRDVPTYSATNDFVPGANSTDIIQLTGSSTKLIRLYLIVITGNVGTAVNSPFLSLVKRSSLASGGTSSSVTMVPHDSQDPAATASLVNFTAAPTVGTQVGFVRAQRWSAPAAATVGEFQGFRWDFGNYGKPIILRGTTETACVNVTGNQPASWSCDFYMEWTEE